MADASVLANAVADSGPDGAAARQLISSEVVHVPDFVYVEVLSVLRKRLQAGSVSVLDCQAALQAFPKLGLQSHPSSALIDRAFELRDSVSPYDAIYVALAESLACDLLTFDGRLSRAHGFHCTVRLV